jgi:hypothetical protein
MKMKNFKKFEEHLKFLKANFPDELEQFLLDMAGSLQRATVRRTPKDTGDLKKGWKISSIERDGDKLFITVYNEEFYAPFVEFGHKVVRNKKVVGKADGSYMLTTSIRSINRQIPRRLRKIFDDLVARL